MSKYNQYQSSTSRPDEKKKVHPIWRGIGCLLVVIIPFLSYVGSIYLVGMKANLTWLIIPEEIIYKNAKDPLIFVKIIYAFIIAFILFAVLGMITFIFNKLFGTSRISKKN